MTYNLIRSALLLTALITLQYCKEPVPDQNQIAAEIRQVEADFMKSVAENGIHNGFLEYAAEDAILIRNSQALEGKKAIADRFSKSTDSGQQLTWSPRKVEVARSGELAYSFGDFIFVSVDSLGQEQTLRGNYCTIWKKQVNNEWKFVFD